MRSSIVLVYLYPSRLDYDLNFRIILTVNSHTAQTEVKIRTHIHIVKNISHLHQFNKPSHSFLKTNLPSSSRLRWEQLISNNLFT